MNKKIFSKFILIAAAFTLTGCTFGDYFKYIFKKDKNTYENKLQFLSDTYYVTRSDSKHGVPTFLKCELKSGTSLSNLTYTLNDTSFGSVDEKGYVVPASDFKAGEVLLRARVDNLKLETTTKIVFLDVSRDIYGYYVDGSSTTCLTLDHEHRVTFLNKDKLVYSNYELKFSDSRVSVTTDEQGFKVTSPLLGKLNFDVVAKSINKTVYSGNILCKLKEGKIESYAREALGKDEYELISKEELASIEELTTSNYLDNPEIKNFDVLKYFPLIKELTIVNNKFDKTVDFTQTYITYLNISNCTLNRINFPVETDYALETLYISSSHLNFTYFNDEHLTHLKKLYLNGNNNGGVLNLHGNDNLIYLNINDCDLMKVEIDNCANLQYFLAADNSLNDLALFENVKLKVLDVANNMFTSLAFLENDDKLIELYLGGNPLSSDKLASISKEVRQNITRLNLSITGATVDLEVIKEFVLDCSSSLKWLQLYGIGLTDISWINETSMPNLTYIKVSHNNITDYSSLSYIAVVVKEYDDTRQD